MRGPAAVALVALLLPHPADALCMTAGTGAKCARAGEGLSRGSAGSWLKPPPGPPREVFAPGTVLPRDRFNIVMGTAYLGLPEPRDGWVYVRLDDEIYRVDRQTLEILGPAERRGR